MRSRRWNREEVTKVDQAEVGDLLGDLASDDGNVVEEARLALEGRLDAVAPLLRVLPSLDRLGTLCAIEVIESWPVDVARRAGNPSVGDVMLPLLRNESDTVREWAAGVLGWIGETKAVPEIEDALRRSKAAGVPAAWTEPVAYRHALTALGAREQLLPTRAAALARREPILGLCWAAHDLLEVVDSLASESQVVLYVQAWRPEGGQFYGEDGPFDYEADLVGDWREVVARGRDAAAKAASAWTPRDGTVVTLEWIAEADR
jgi:hypothetical protein